MSSDDSSSEDREDVYLWIFSSDCHILHSGYIISIWTNIAISHECVTAGSLNHLVFTFNTAKQGD